MYRNKEREIRKQKNDFHCDPYRNEEEVRKQRIRKWKMEFSQLKRRNMETKK